MAHREGRHSAQQRQPGGTAGIGSSPDIRILAQQCGRGTAPQTQLQRQHQRQQESQVVVTLQQVVNAQAEVVAQRRPLVGGAGTLCLRTAACHGGVGHARTEQQAALLRRHGAEQILAANAASHQKAMGRILILQQQVTKTQVLPDRAAGGCFGAQINPVAAAFQAIGLPIKATGTRRASGHVKLGLLVEQGQRLRRGGLDFAPGHAAVSVPIHRHDQVKVPNRHRQHKTQVAQRSSTFGTCGVRLLHLKVGIAALVRLCGTASQTQTHRQHQQPAGVHQGAKQRPHHLAALAEAAMAASRTSCKPAA